MSRPTESDCCASPIRVDLIGGQSNWEFDRCTACGKTIHYAWVWAKPEPVFGVCQLWDDRFYYFAQIRTNWPKEEPNSAYETYIGQVKQIWTVASEWNRDIDRIPTHGLRDFSLRWKAKVSNPEYGVSSR